jgi:hypothetical protein
MKPFDYINSINNKNKDMMTGTENDELAEKSYNAYLTNRSLSYFIDTILYANDMNMMSHLDNKMQYQYYMHAVPKKNRFSKWAKKDTTDVDIITEFYKCNLTRANEILKIINKDELDLMKQKLQQAE